MWGCELQPKQVICEKRVPGDRSDAWWINMVRWKAAISMGHWLQAHWAVGSKTSAMTGSSRGHTVMGSEHWVCYPGLSRMYLEAKLDFLQQLPEECLCLPFPILSPFKSLQGLCIALKIIPKSFSTMSFSLITFLHYYHHWNMHRHTCSHMLIHT